MRILPSLAALGALLATLVFAAPARAVETGVNETMNQSVALGATAQGVGADWVRLWAAWELAERTRGQVDQNYLNWLGAKVDDAKARGIKVLVVVGRSPTWASAGGSAIAPPDDPADYGRFMGELARKLPAVDAWELWNEADGPEFFAGGAQPGVYAAMVKAAYPAIKRAQPHDVVMTGGTVGNNMDFIAQLYAHGAKGSFDAVAVHTDTACLTSGPDFFYRDEQGRIGRYAFTGHREVHAVMAQHGDGAKPIWMTELGWSTQSTAPNSCSVGERKGTKPLGVTEAEQAAFLAQAYRCIAADPFVQTALWFGVQDIEGSAHAGGYGLYRLDGTPKPSAAAFRELDAGIPPQPCGSTVDKAGPEIRIRKPTRGARFRTMFAVNARGVDSTGGLGIERLEMWHDGRFERSFGDGHARMPHYWPSKEWKLGRHKLTFKAEDKAGNRTAVSITVTKVKRLPKARTSATLALTPLGGLGFSVAGAVKATRARAAGAAVVTFQKRTAAGWSTVHRIRRPARRAVALSQTVESAGRWRVFLRYRGAQGFKPSRSKPVVFDAA